MKKKVIYPLPSKLQTLKAKGMPVYSANFKDPIHNESRMTRDDLRPDRRAEMTLTAVGLLVEQDERRPHITDNYKGIEFLSDAEIEAEELKKSNAASNVNK